MNTGPDLPCNLIQTCKKERQIRLRLEVGVGRSLSEYHVFDQFVPAPYEENVSAMAALLREWSARALLLTRPTALTRTMTAEDLRSQHIQCASIAQSSQRPQLLESTSRCATTGAHRRPRPGVQRAG